MTRHILIVFMAFLWLSILSTPILAPGCADTVYRDMPFNRVFQDLVADYALYASLLYDTSPLDQYNIALHANNTDEAIAYLADGFDITLAQNIVNYYLLWLPEQDKMAIIPTESIPIITGADQPHLRLQQISPYEVLMERTYTNCYEVDDIYLYKIHMRQKGERWIVTDLQFDKMDTTGTL